MKTKWYKALACALALGLAVTPSTAFAAGAGTESADAVVEDDTEEDIWEDESEELDDWEDDSEEDEYWEDDSEEMDDWEDEYWEDEPEETDDWEIDFDGGDEPDDCVEDTCVDIDEEYWDECYVEVCGLEGGSDNSDDTEDAEDCDAEDAGACGVSDDAEAEGESEDAEAQDAVNGQGGNVQAAAAVETASSKTQGQDSVVKGYAASKDSAIAGTYAAAKKTQLRADAGIGEAEILEMDEEAEVHCYGYYTETSGEKWYYVQCFQDGKAYVGFCSSEDLK